MPRKTSQLSRLVSLLVVILSAGAACGQGLINGDFSSSAIGDAGGGGAPVPYSAVDDGWWAKDAANNWEISGGQLNEIGRTGSETRVVQFFTNNMIGTGWSLDLTLGTSGNATQADNILVWGGTDDGNNAPGDKLIGLGGDGPPDAGIVSGGWTELVNMEDVDADGAKSYPIAEDLSDFDLIGVMITNRNSNGPATLTVDDVQFFNPNAAVPEPASFAIWSLIGLGLAGFGYFRIRRDKK